MSVLRPEDRKDPEILAWLKNHPQFDAEELFEERLGWITRDNGVVVAQKPGGKGYGIYLLLDGYYSKSDAEYMAPLFRAEVAAAAHHARVRQQFALGLLWGEHKQVDPADNGEDWRIESADMYDPTSDDDEEDGQ